MAFCILYKKLVNYPQISDWEKRNLIEFSEYESCHGRHCDISCKDQMLINEIQLAMSHPEKYRATPRPN